MHVNRGFYKHGNLPHLDVGDSLQFLTFVLDDAAPKQQHAYRKAGKKLNGEDLFIRIDNQLDRHAGSCILARPGLAACFIDALHWASHELHIPLAWVVMPNHVHFIVRQLPGVQLSRIVHSIKAGSARLMNQKLKRSGKLWQRSYYDRQIRDMQHLEQTIDYIHENPAKAGLISDSSRWKFSSIQDFSNAKLEQAFSYKCYSTET